MESRQAIATPFGVTVFGSAMSRVAPDIASIRCSVSRLEQKPKDAFAKARQGAQSVQDCLRNARISDYGASRIALVQQNGYVKGEMKFLGYQAKVSFRVVLTE